MDWSSKTVIFLRVDLLLQARVVEALRQERRGVGVTRVALDDDVRAGRDSLEQRLCLRLADGHVVERDVQDLGVLDQAVIGDDGDAGVLGLLQRGDDGVGVLRQEHEDIGATVDERLDVGVLLQVVEVGVEVEEVAAVVDDLALHVGAVGGCPARLLEVVPRHADVADTVIGLRDHCGGRHQAGADDGQGTGPDHGTPE